MTPKLSIITPSFNQAAYIERTIRSVLDQGWENLEYMVIDGGSTDGSAEIIERYADRLAWWVSEKDNGQTDAINKGLRRATGDVVAFINSDDYYEPGAFEKAVAALEGSDAAWVVGASRFIDSDAGTEEVWVPSAPVGGKPWWLLAPWGVPQPSAFWRREAFEQHGYFREDMHYIFDTEHGLRMALAGAMPLMFDDVLAVRWLHDEAKSFDRTPFIAEQDRLFDLHRDKLTAAEQRRYRLLRRMERMGVLRVLERGSRVWRGAGLPALRK